MSPSPFARLPPRLRQILWFMALWCAGILALSAVAYPIRWVLLG